MISDSTIRTALVDKIKAINPTAQVHRRRRYPQQERVEEYKKIFLSEDGIINTYMIRRLRRIPSLAGVPKRLVSVTYVYEIRFYLGLSDSDDDSAASEEQAQLLVDQLANGFESDNSLGLGASISHTGLEMPSDFEDVLLGDWASHRARMVIEITAANVNCGGAN